MKSAHIQHLYWRAGFGITPNEMASLKKKSTNKVVKALFKNSKNYTPLEVDLSELAIIRDKNYKQIKKEKGPDFQRNLVKLSRKKGVELNAAWIDRLGSNNEILREKMTLFWANVFVCKDNNTFDIQHYNNVLRKNALGNFGDFTKAISHEASMIRYLNNKQNRKGKPNENFARELMELFTLGAGNYTENDIKESARAFTGWNTDKKGNFIFQKKFHDFGNKTFFGKTGNFDGNDIIDIILEQKQCARFISEKIYKYFVNPVVNEAHLEELTTIFYKDYNIENLMQYIFTADWFYDEENIGVKIKSPIELLVGINKVVPVRFEKVKHQIYFQKMMGQILLNPVNVAGWKGGKSWIDSNTLMFRLKVPSVILNNAVINLEEKGDIEADFKEFYAKKKNRKGYFKTSVSWNEFEKNYQKLTAEELKESLIIGPFNPQTAAFINNLKVTSNRDFCVQLMSIPEYQLC
ncbi:DUF1800 domain-containing protein [Flavicella marina]|uniref:DUF1800 domain-containing protein n=1 Tax=Flavicella marina TaxID=1475951 RepID=UPI0012658FF5|nr:DUF1800 domain-containing protein [Flavicella marina]